MFTIYKFMKLPLFLMGRWIEFNFHKGMAILNCKKNQGGKKMGGRKILRLVMFQKIIVIICKKTTIKMSLNPLPPAPHPNHPSELRLNSFE